MRVSQLFTSLLCILAGKRVKPTICLELPFPCRMAWRRRDELVRRTQRLNRCSYSPAKGELRDHESQEIKLAGKGRRLNLLQKQGLTLLKRHSGISNSPGHKGFKKVCARPAQFTMVTQSQAAFLGIYSARAGGKQSQSSQSKSKDAF